jgi:hypothetical protein
MAGRVFDVVDDHFPRRATFYVRERKQEITM